MIHILTSYVKIGPLIFFFQFRVAQFDCWFTFSLKVNYILTSTAKVLVSCSA